MTVTVESLSVLVAITLVNFLYLLMQVVMAAENCGVIEAVPHVARLLRRRWKELGQVLAAILALMLMATGASILATTQLGLMGLSRSSGSPPFRCRSSRGWCEASSFSSWA